MISGRLARHVSADAVWKFIRTPKDNVGFDLLQARLQKNSKGVYEAHIENGPGPLGRPMDVHLERQRQNLHLQ